MKKLIVIAFLFISALAFGQSAPVNPIQLQQNALYLEPSTGLRWGYNGAAHGWYKIDTTRNIFISNQFKHTGDILSQPLDLMLDTMKTGRINYIGFDPVTHSLRYDTTQFGTGGGVNIYNHDGVVTDPLRTVTLNNNTLLFDASSGTDSTKVSINKVDGFSVMSHGGGDTTLFQVNKNSIEGSVVGPGLQNNYFYFLDSEGGIQTTNGHDFSSALVQSAGHTSIEITYQKDSVGVTTFKRLRFGDRRDGLLGILVTDEPDNIGFVGDHVFPKSSHPAQYAQYGKVDSLIAAAGGGVNIYNSDGRLTSERTVDLGPHSLFFNSDLGLFGVFVGDSLVNHTNANLNVSPDGTVLITQGPGGSSQVVTSYVLDVQAPSVLMQINRGGRESGIGIGTDTSKSTIIFDRIHRLGMEADSDYSAKIRLNPNAYTTSKAVKLIADSVKSTISSSGITAITGDGTATGPGSAAFTLATVNSTPGSYGDATHVATMTTNAKGLTTASGSVAITFPVTPSNTITFSNKDFTGSGNTFPTFNQNTTGSAASLATARNINGVPFDGTGNITITSATPNALTNGFGVNSLSYTGASGAAVVIDTAVAVKGKAGFLTDYNNLSTRINGKQASLGFTPYNATNPSNYIALTAISATSPIFYNNSTGVISSQAASGSQNGYLLSTDWTTFNGKQGLLTFDSTPTTSSTNPVTSGGVFTALATKQGTLTFDSTPTSSSTNPVTSGGVFTALGLKLNISDTAAMAYVHIAKNETITGAKTTTKVFTVSLPGIGTAQTPGLLVNNPDIATVGVQKYGPAFGSYGSGWKTTATAGAQAVGWFFQTRPIQGTTSPTTSLDLFSDINGSQVSRYQFGSDGTLSVGNNVSASGVFIASGASTLPGMNTVGANFYFPSLNGAGTSSNAVYEFDGNAFNHRVVFSGGTQMNITAGQSAANYVFTPSATMVTAASLTNNIIANVVFKPQTFTATAGSTVTNAYNVVFRGNAIGTATNVGDIWALGMNRFSGVRVDSLLTLAAGDLTVSTGNLNVTAGNITAGGFVNAPNFTTAAGGGVQWEGQGYSHGTGVNTGVVFNSASSFFTIYPVAGGHALGIGTPPSKTGTPVNIISFTDGGLINIPGLTASKVVFTDASKNLTSTGIGTSSQYIAGDGSLGTIGARPHTIFTPTTGGTVTLTNNQYNIINPAGALLALTVTLPSSPANNDCVFIKYTQNVTTVTYSGGTVVDGITAPTAGGLVVLTYDTGTTSWY